MQGLNIWFESSDAPLPGRVRLEMGYEPASRLYEYVKKEMSSLREDYEYAKRSGQIPMHILDALEREKNAFAVIYKGVVDAYLSREDI